MKVVLISILLASSSLLCYTDEVPVDSEEFFPEQLNILSISKNKVEDASSVKALSEELTKKLLTSVKETKDSFNDRADEIIAAVRQEILMGPWDPADIDGYDIDFEYRPLLITYSGTLGLTIGRIQDLSTVSRNGDATLSWTYPDNTVTVSIPLAFRNIIASYNFLMEVRGDTVEGVLYAWVDDITANYSITIDMDTKTVLSGNVDLDIGSLEIDLQTVSITRAYRDLITELTTDLMHEVVSEQADSIVGSLLNSAVFAVVDDI